MIMCNEKTLFCKLDYLVDWEESKHKIIDNWYTDVGLMEIQFLGILTKLLSKIAHIICEQIMPPVVLGSPLWASNGGYFLSGSHPRDHQMPEYRFLNYLNS